MTKPRRLKHRYIGERAWSAVKLATATFVIVIGALAAIKEILQIHESRWEIIWALAITSIGSLLFGMWEARVMHIPDVPFLGAGDTQNLRCTICTANQLCEANILATSFYGRDAISDDVVEQWRLTNPNMYACVLNPSGEVESSFSVMPLTDSFLDQFIAGKVIEAQIAADDIIPPSDSRRSSRLYIGGVVVKDPRSPRGQMRIGAMLWAMLVYLRKFYGLKRKRTLYALAATKEGERLLKHLNFSLVCSASQREDGHDLYSLSLDSESVGSMEHNIPDYHQICCIDFDQKVKSHPKSRDRASRT